MKSDRSMGNPPNFSSEPVPSDPRTETQGAGSPVLSAVSMKSDRSMGNPPNFSSEPVPSDPRTETQGAGSPVLSAVSMKSDRSMGNPPNFSSEPVPSDPSIQDNTTNICREKLDHVFKELQQKCISLVKNELNTFKKALSLDYPSCPKREGGGEDDQGRQREWVLKITLNFLRNMKETDLANTLQSKLAPAFHWKLKSKLKDKYERINEGITGHASSERLNDIYTELYMTEGGSGKVNQEHEIKQIEAASRKKATQEIPIKCSNIFNPLHGQNQPIRTVLTKGVAGIGKTVSVQKFILDWAEGEVNQDVRFIFPLPFRELNLMKEKKLSLVDLLQRFFPETHKLKPRHYKQYKIVFIFDGLDEYRLPLDFQNNKNLRDIDEQTSVDVLLTNLIKGNLLPSALLWITSRPAAVRQIPPEYVDQVTEVRGFSDPQKQEYFSKRIRDQDLANKVFTHIRSSRSLYIMCHIPAFCWITASVLEGMLSKVESEEIPKTLTQMFTHFLIFQIKQSQKYSGKGDLDLHQTRESILALGKLAFQQLEKGNLIFYEEDLRESGIDIREVSVYSGVCTQIFREEYEMHLGKVFSFVHLSVQEFLAAFYAFLHRKIPIQQTTEQQNTEQQTINQKPFSFLSRSNFLIKAVDRALQSESGHLDLFLRFLLGLSLESNQTLLRGVLTPTAISAYSNKETVEYIKRKIEKSTSPEKSINLFHCLNELKDHSLVLEVQELRRLNRRRIHQATFSPAQWSALVFVLLNSEEELEEFDLNKFNVSEECFHKLLPVFKASRRAVLVSSYLSMDSWRTLASALKSADSCLKEVYLCYKYLQDSELKLLVDGLSSSHCQLKTLRLDVSNVEKVCESLGSALQLPDFTLKELDLSNNHLMDSGVELLFAGLKSSHCKLEALGLMACNLEEKVCESLGSALQLPHFTLKELDLSNNDLMDSGVELLSAGLGSSHCKLERLQLSGCIVTEKGCSSLATALRSNPSFLRELDLTYNYLGESGVKLLSDLLKDPQYKLDTLRVERGGEIMMNLGMKKYVCELTLDPQTAHIDLVLCKGNRKVTFGSRPQLYPDRTERFDYQVLSQEALTGRCYWEVEWSGNVEIALAYKEMCRKGNSWDYEFDFIQHSWSLHCSNMGFSARHNNNYFSFPLIPCSPCSNHCTPNTFRNVVHCSSYPPTPIRSPYQPPCCRRVGVYLDWTAGILSFYRVSSCTHTLTRLHTFRSTFTEPLYAGFWVCDSFSECEIQKPLSPRTTSLCK